MPQQVRILVPGGRATPGPPLGPTLGPLGINIKQVVDAINQKTGAFDGMSVPVVLTVADDKSFSLEVGTPPASALILKALGLEKGSKEAGKNMVGNLTISQAVEIARRKESTMLSRSLKAAVKQVVGTCVSMGVTVEGKSPKEVQAEIDQGLHDAALAPAPKASKKG
ncbi:MAG: 50S ribosomal protein L11 [Euryarchaeota archaeon]|nr:50S ribosomal protein L11 [Euryarchaeota archaeon]